MLRKKRLNFYLNNNFYLTNYLSIEKNGNFNIMVANTLSNNNFEIKNYIELDKKFLNGILIKNQKLK